MRTLYILILTSILLYSCSTDEGYYSYLSRPDAAAEAVQLKLSTTTTDAEFYYRLQAKEMYIEWGDNSKPTEYIFTGNDNLLDSIKPTSKIYNSQGTFDINIKSLNLVKLDLSKTDNTSSKNRYNSISELILTDCRNLEDLRFTGQPITTVDLSECTTLIALYCGYNEGTQSVTGLENLTKLETLNITGSLSSSTIDLSTNVLLKNITVTASNCETINIGNNPVLEAVVLTNNLSLNAAALNTLFAALPQVTGTEHTVTLSGNNGDSLCDKTIATQKGWIFK